MVMKVCEVYLDRLLRDRGEFRDDKTGFSILLVEELWLYKILLVVDNSAKN
jgi:hypothetical protein